LKEFGETFSLARFQKVAANTGKPVFGELYRSFLASAALPKPLRTDSRDTGIGPSRGRSRCSSAGVRSDLETFGMFPLIRGLRNAINVLNAPSPAAQLALFSLEIQLLLLALKAILD